MRIKRSPILHVNQTASEAKILELLENAVRIQIYSAILAYCMMALHNDYLHEI